MNSQSVELPRSDRTIEAGMDGSPTLAQQIEAHERWVSSHGKEGQRAMLAGQNLAGADLNQVDLREADLTGVNLRDAKLRGANFSRANLERARLDRADLRDADLSRARLLGADLSGAVLDQAQVRGALLRDADLRHTDLSSVVGLLPNQLGGTLLIAAKLPRTVEPFEGLGSVADASRTTQGLFTSILLICAYTWLTIASTTDAQLLNNAAPPSSRLPILGVDIPLVRFYLVAPVLLAAFYLYAHLNLQRLWEELSDLPAVFPDGRTLDRKAYPWMMNGLVREHAPRLRANRSPLSRWQSRMSTVLAWGLVPMTILVMWCRYLRTHDWTVTVAHIFLIALCAGTGYGFLRLAASTLRGAEHRPGLWGPAWRRARGASLIVGLGFAAILWTVSFGVIEGVNPTVVWSEDVAKQLCRRYYWVDPRRWAPSLLQGLGLSPSAVLDDAVLAVKPANWSREVPDLNAVRGADLENRNLRFARAYNAFIANSYLHYADMSWGDFRESDFRKADLREVNITGTNLRDAYLDEADLRKATGVEPRLYAAELNRAKLKQAVLPGANFERAQLRGADLSEADLTGASFVGAKLDPYRSDLAPSRPSSLRSAQLEGADFTGADLTEADLSNANLRYVNFADAILAGANLDGADVTGATNLTPEQLEANPAAPETDNALKATSSGTGLAHQTPP